MQIEQFELFCQVARVKSFSKAAKLLHISQPAISAQIQSMEDFYGIKLFERTPHGVNPTPAGNVLHDYAKRLIEIHEDLERKLTGMADDKNQRLVIGATPAAGNHALACNIWAFRDKHPDLSLSLEIGKPQEIMSKLADQTIDLAIIESPVSPQKGLTVKPIFVDELVAIVPNGPQWAVKKRVTMDELRKDRLILREEGSEIHYILDEALQPLGLCFADLRPNAVISNSNAIRTAVENGHGVSIALKLTIQKEIRHGNLLALPIDQIDPRVVYSLVYREKELTGVAKRFIRSITAPGELEIC